MFENTMILIQKYKQIFLNISLLFIFIFIYGQTPFLYNEDIALISAVNADAASQIKSILGLYDKPYYNMFNSYHSHYYGWTFYSLTALILLPFKIVNSFLFGDTLSDILAIKLIFFAYGIALITIFFNFLSEYNHKKNTLFAYLLTLNLIFPFSHDFFVTLHPEIIGMIFLLLAFKAILATEFKYKIFKLNIFFAMSSMAKQTFFFASFPFLIFYNFYFQQKIKVQNKNIKNRFLFCTLIFVIVAFIIHPYLFIDPIKFLKAQGELFFSFQKDEIGFFKNSFTWLIKLYKFDKIIFSSILLFPFSLFVFRLLPNYPKVLVDFNKVSAVAFFFGLFMIFKGNSTIFSPHYFLPLALFSYINISFLYFSFCSFRNKVVSILLRFLLITLVIFNLAINFSGVNNFINSYQNSVESLPIKTLNYIDQLININSDIRIAHDHFVGSRQAYKGKNTCHYWNSCSNDDALNEFNPDYVMYNNNWKWAGKVHLPNEMLRLYISKNNFLLIDTIEDKIKNIKVHVYKKIEIKK
jgi:hypothetical protein